MESEYENFGCEKYKGFYILKGYKMIYGKLKETYSVEQYDVILFQSASIDECKDFCDRFGNCISFVK